MEAIKENIRITKEKLNEDGRVNSKAHVRRNTDAFEFIEDHIKEPLLDIGCRNGLLLGVLKDKGCKDISGMDIIDNSLDDKSIKYYKCDAHKLYINKSFNMVIMSHMLEHTYDPKTVLDNVYNILNENGLLFIEVPLEEENRPEVGHFSHFSNKTKLYKLFANKFTIIKEDLDIKEKRNNKRIWLRVLVRKV